MAREDVNIKVSANVAEAIRMWQAMEAGPKAMANELSALGSKGRSAGDSIAGGFDKAIGKWSTLAAKISGAKGLLDAWMQGNLDAMRQQDQASVSLDTMSRHFQVQAGMGDAAMAGVQKQINAIAKARGVAAKDAWAMGQQMQSSGFTPDTILEGGALDAGLMAANAMGATGKGFDAQQFTAALGQYLNATKQDKSTENVLRLGQNLYNLFQKTNLQPGDLTELAPEAAKIRDATGMADDDILSVFSQFREVTSAAQASTAMRAGYTKLAGAKGDSTVEGALEELGLTPQDVAFKDGNFLQVQDRIAKALEGVGEEDRAWIVKDLFGEEGSLWASVLGSKEGVAQTRERTGWANDSSKFAEASRVSEGSLEAEANRADTDTMAVFAKTESVTSDIARDRMMAGLKKRGAWQATRDIARWGFDKAIAAGESVEEAVEWATPGTKRGSLPWRAISSIEDREQFIREVTQRTGGSSLQGITGSLDRIAKETQEITIRFVDQNNMRIPHKAEVHDVGKNAAGRK